MFAEWETIFKALGRTYNTKKSKDNVKLLEDCGLLKQIKMPNSNARIKIVADVSLKNIRFINPDYDVWRAEQAANNAERVAEFAEFNAEKEKAIKQAKNVETKTVKSESKVEPVANIENTGVDVKQETEIVEPESKTNWELHSNALITQNDKYNKLNQGYKMRTMLAVNQCQYISFKAIKEVFDLTIDKLLSQEPKQYIKQIGGVCNGCYQVEFGTGWMCTNRNCENHDAEHEAKRLDDLAMPPI
ncbi:hypothetical protein ACE1BY_13775, partial [Aeromonas jandaei]|uniref:hypothetical protein n=2 Tax=Aeromonas jandaei TaxID=650 RepID=UPI0035B8C8FF